MPLTSPRLNYPHHPHHAHPSPSICRLAAGSHIVTVGQMATCDLTAASNFELQSYTKCTSWGQASPAVRVMFGMVVSGVSP